MASQWLGNAVDWLGRALNIPETGKSESIAGGPTTTTGTDPRSTSAGFVPYTPAYQTLNVPSGVSSSGWSAVYAQPSGTSTTGGVPSTGGSVTGGQVPTGGGDTGGGPSAEDQLRADIESIFSPVMSYLGQAESTLGQNYQSAQEEIANQYGLSQQTLASEKGTSEKTLAKQETEAGTRKEDALTSATRLYNELQRGGQQRFGGASSAGEAYQSLTAVEQQRRQGAIQTAYEGAMQKVGEYKANLEEKYNMAVKELETEKNSALNAAQQDFRNQMLSITQMKAEAESNKAQLRLESLQNLRNQVYAINLQSLQFAQQLAANKQMSLAKVDEFTKQALANVTGGQNTVSATLAGYQPTSNYGASAPVTQTSNQAYTGIASPTRKYDEFGNLIA